MTHFTGSPFRKFTSWKFASERVEPKRGVAHVEARLTTVAVDDLRPVSRRIARFFKCAVVLRAALKLLAFDRGNREALELQC